MKYTIFFAILLAVRARAEEEPRVGLDLYTETDQPDDLRIIDFDVLANVANFSGFPLLSCALFRLQRTQLLTFSQGGLRQ